MQINPYSRIQSFTIQDLYPSIPGFCAFGCGKALKGKRTRWCSDLCSKRAGWQLSIKNEIPDVIRTELKKRDKDRNGNIFCADCTTQVDIWNETHTDIIKWDADHILAVCNGGGGLGLDNYKIRCQICHRLKTKQDLKTKKQNRECKRIN